MDENRGIDRPQKMIPCGIGRGSLSIIVIVSCFFILPQKNLKKYPKDSKYCKVLENSVLFCISTHFKAKYRST